MKRYLLLVFSILFTCSFAFSVSSWIQVPSQFATIQAAINISNNGDTILVAPGTYHENINFNGKNVFLTSNYHISKDPNDIVQTIIDGSGASTVVIFNNGEDSTTYINGFTVQKYFKWFRPFKKFIFKWPEIDF